MEEQEILAAIQKINLRYSDKQFIITQNGNVLSYTALKLASLKAYLIEIKELAHGEMLDAEIEMDKQKALAYGRAMKESNATAAKDLKYADEEFIADNFELKLFVNSSWLQA